VPKFSIVFEFPGGGSITSEIEAVDQVTAEAIVRAEFDKFWETLPKDRPPKFNAGDVKLYLQPVLDKVVDERRRKFLRG
jgi:hypothetical protein